MKHINFKKIILPLFVAILMAVIVMIQQLAFPVKAYADEVQETEKSAYSTFLDVRTNAKYESGLTEDEKYKQFVSWEFQQNSDNFETICANKIGDIVDTRYNKTLEQEAQAITLKSEGDIPISEQSTLTVLTYGQGSGISYWSNDGDPNYKFAYDKDSLIENLRRASDADVYIATTEAFKVSYGSKYKFNISVGNSATVSLYKIEATEASYLDYTSNKMNKIQDMSKHNIIIFDSKSSSQYHNFVYNELNAILTQISYDYLLTIGQVPKISMISHSTGGVWNMMWATRHPFNVDRLEAIAAPFNGTTLGYYLYTDGEYWNKTALSDTISGLYGSVTCPSGFNNIDDKRLNSLHSEWETATKKNNKLRCYAYTGMTSLSLIKAFDPDSKWLGTFIDTIDGVPSWITGGIVEMLVKYSAILSTVILSGVISLANFFHKLEVVVPFTNVIACALDSFADTIKNYYFSFGHIAVYILNALAIDRNGELVLRDDCTVDYRSALGSATYGDDSTLIENILGDLINLPNNIELTDNCMPKLVHNEYSNFVRSYTVGEGTQEECVKYNAKTFRIDNCNPERRSSSMPAVPHNLESLDADIIEDVCGSLVMTAPETRYNCENLKDNTICIVGVKKEYYNEQIVFPDIICGKKVSAIDGDGECILNEIVDDDGSINVAYIDFGNNIKYIGDHAFDGCKSLNGINLSKSLVEIGEYAFYRTGVQYSQKEIGNDKTTITFNFPNTLERIGKFAFAETSLLAPADENGLKVEYIGGSNLNFVGEGAFDKTDFIDQSTDNVIIGKVLIKYKSQKTELVLKNDYVKFFAQKCFEGSCLKKLDASEFNFDGHILPDYFLYGATNLNEFIFPDKSFEKDEDDINVYIIGRNAFEHTTSLAYLTIPRSVEVIGIEAFIDSGITELTLDTPYPPNISKADTFKNCTNLSSVWVKKYAQSNFIETWCDESILSAIKPELINSHKSTLLFKDGDVSEIIENDIYYCDYIADYWWMQDGKYTKVGYYFEGWFDSTGKQYYAGSLLEFEWEENKDWILEAKWQIESYNIMYETYGGTVDAPETVTIESKVILPDSVKTGYNFIGWYDNPEFKGEPISVLKNVKRDMKLFAKFEAFKVSVKYDTTDIEKIERENDSFDYGKRFFAPVPEKTGYAFAGWYTENGERITGINGVSLKNLSFTETTILYAHWTAKSFVIEYNNGTNSFVLGNDGLTTEAGSVLFGQRVDINSQAFIDMFECEGYWIDGFANEQGQKIRFNNGVPDLGENFSTFVVSPIYVAKQYTISLYDNIENGKLFKKITVSYDDLYDFDISREGYEFAGWTDGKYVNGELNIVLKNKSDVLITDLLPSNKKGGTIALYASWTAIKGNIRFNSNGGTKIAVGSGYVSEFGKKLNAIPVPSRNGYNFLGFYDDTGKMYINIITP